MEPMALGSPSGSSACGNNSQYLPNFLMGEGADVCSRNNTLSPNKGRCNLNFSVTSPQLGASSPPDYNRSTLTTQKTLFSLQQQNLQKNQSFNNSGFQNHNTSISTGPPQVGLFDSLRNENNSIDENSSILNRSVAFKENNNLTVPHGLGTSAMHQRTMNDSYLTAGGTSFDSPRMQQISTPRPREFCNFNNQSICSPPTSPNLWVTVFGFPPTAIQLILSHFSQYGTILDKVFAPQNGNWVHLKYSSVLECDKALNFHEKIVGNNIMIAVTICRDPSALHKRALIENNMNTSSLRPLAKASYNNAQSENAVMPNANNPQRSSGLVNKAMDLLFGW